jgi:hypothetical protein
MDKHRATKNQQPKIQTRGEATHHRNCKVNPLVTTTSSLRPSRSLGGACGAFCRKYKPPQSKSEERLIIKLKGQSLPLRCHFSVSRESVQYPVDTTPSCQIIIMAVNATSSPDITKPVVVADPTKGVKMDATLVAQPFRNEIKAKIEAMKLAGMGALLVV